MKHSIYLIILLLFAMSAHGQSNNSDLIPFSIKGSADVEYYGFKTLSGEVVIPAKYRDFYTDTMRNMAIVMTADWQMVCIDRSDSILCRPFIYDNGPDYIEEGVFRIVENGKMGFANTDGEIVIPAVFDFVYPFADGEDEFKEEGIAEYVMGGRLKTMGEHSWWVDGHESGYINHSGERFTKVGKLKNGKRKAWTTDGKQVTLDKNGNVI